MTTYYNISTNDISKYWDTNKIIEYINNSNMFIYKNNGYFECVNEYCIISLVYTNDFDSYVSQNDFNITKTNLISVVTSHELSNKVMKFLKNLAEKLNAELVEEE